MIGKTLGHYEITSQLGKGGMGEVYQATDSKLGRNVAIKVLPEEFAKDAGRVARFQREAKLLASLNHPNIAAIHGLEESAGTNFLVLELVEGETLSDRLRHGPIPGEESLKLALQIAEALEAAHEKGVIHRDLKPANIKVTPEGKVKVLDFGLAKAYAGEQAELNLSNSPTLSDMATQQGVILGTAAYMSPEQARGKSVDKRADIWAFGVVLYEMLTGRSLFAGDDVSQTLAKILERQPDFSLLPPNIHLRIVEILQRCLVKEARNRCHDIADVRIDIQKVLAGPEGVFMPLAAKMGSRRSIQTMLQWVAAILIIAAIVGMAVWRFKPTEPKRVMRFYYELPQDQRFSDLTLPVLAVSPDGRQFIYSTTKGLYLRSVDELGARLIPGTEGNPRSPFFSPDGKWIGYYSVTDHKLKKILIGGGAPVVLCAANDVLNASWGTDDRVVYGEQGRGIMRISANGGNPELLVKQIGINLVNPQILPDGETALFGIIKDLKTLHIAVQAPKSDKPKVLIEGDNARYLPTGHLVNAAQNSLFAVLFNLDRLEIAGGLTPMIVDVFRQGNFAPHQYAISDSGTLVYIPSSVDATAQRSLAWVDRNGNEVPIAAAAPKDYGPAKISPDGTKVALAVHSESNKSDIYILDLFHETMTRLTFNEGSDYPLWTRDGKRIVFNSYVGTAYVVCWKAADGTGVDERLSPEDLWQVPSSWSRDGRMLLLNTLAGASGSVRNRLFISALQMEGDHNLKPLLQERFAVSSPSVSPDGRWMAYTSEEWGKSEVYVRPFPDVNKGKWQVSTSGGEDPLWSPDGRELFYRNGNSVMAVAVQTEVTFKYGKTEALFQGKYDSTWDISRDGKRFLMLKALTSSTAGPAAEGPRKINIVVNWTEELKQRVPVK